MALDGITTAALVHELSTKLTGSRVSKIAQPERDEMMITFRGLSGQNRVLLSAAASCPLLYITDDNKPAPMTAPGFCMLLRKHIGSGKVLQVYQPSLERAVHFEFEHYNEMGDLCRKELIIELMGKHSNLIFCDDKQMILDSIKHISAQTSSVREVLPGRTYFLPETTEKLDPLTCSEEEFAQKVFSRPLPLAKAIYTSVTGISPVIAEELCYRAGLDSGRAAGAASPEEQIHLSHIFALMMEDVKAGRFSPMLVMDQENCPIEFSAVPLQIYQDYPDTYRIQTFDSISALLQSYYALRESVMRIRQKSSDLRRIASTAADRAARKLQLQEKQLADTAKRDTYRIYGELLHTYGYDARPGDKSIKVINYYDGQEMTIPLDPTLTASENAKRYYDKYDKMKRTYEALSVQIKETQDDLNYLESVKTFLDMAGSEADLAQCREELTQAGYIRFHATGKNGKKQKTPASPPYHYQTEDGWDLYVGRNNIQNDELTFKFASGNDWWFHSKGAPGSHVILKNKGTDIPDHVFEDAARLAAYYSSRRNDGRVEIDYVQKREVKKPNGSHPGFVVYYTNYSMMIDTDISRLTLVQ